MIHPGHNNPQSPSITPDPVDEARPGSSVGSSVGSSDRHSPAARVIRRARRVGTAAVILILGVLLAGCSTGSLPRGAGEQEAARFLAYSPGPRINPGDGLVFRFHHEYGRAGEALSQDLLSQVVGIQDVGRLTARWQDARTMVVYPESEPWPQGRVLEGWMNLSALHGRGGAEPSADVIFRFSSEVAVQGIYQSRFSLGQGQAGEDLYPQIRLSLGILPGTGDIDSAPELSFQTARGSIPARVSLEGSELLVTGTSPISRGQSAQTLGIEIPRGYLDLPQTWQAQWTVPPRGSLQLEEVVEDEVLELVFSEDIDPAQQLGGAVFTTPETDLVFEVRGNRIIITQGLERGEIYQITITPALRSIYGSRLSKELTFQGGVPNHKPKVEFLQSGSILTSGADSRIYIRTMNLRGLSVRIQEVFENNLVQFLQTQSLGGEIDRSREFDGYEVNRVGRTLASQELEIGETENEWLVHELDLSPLLPDSGQNLYLVSLEFDREDMIWESPEDGEYHYGNDYYENPSSWGYLYQHGRRYKPILVSDLGLTFLAGQHDGLAAVTHIPTGNPLAGAEVEVYSFQNQVIARGRTDSRGLVRLFWGPGSTGTGGSGASGPGAGDSSGAAESARSGMVTSGPGLPGPSGGGPTAAPFIVFARTGDSQAVLPLDQFTWNLSGFDVGGQQETPSGLRGYLFTERGVYRPGDTVTLFSVIRNSQGSFPDNHPVTLEVFNPRGQLYLERSSTDGRDGLYRFSIPTRASDPTGGYRVQIQAGDATFTHIVRVETILPDRLRLSMDVEPETLEPRAEQLTVNLTSEYLFGSPAAGLPGEISLTVEDRPLRIPGYEEFHFSHPTKPSQPYSEVLFSGPLDEGGGVSVDVDIPVMKDPPGALVLGFSGRVTEAGGRSVRGITAVPYDPYHAYVGIRAPDFDFGYAPLGEESQIQIILTDPRGSSIENRTLQYRLYKNDRYWWWEYDDYRDFRLSYKNDRHTQVVSQGTITTGTLPKNLGLTPDEWGEYMLEVEDPQGHSAGIFFRASSWSSPGNAPDSGIMELKTDKTSYRPGDTARVTIPTTRDTQILVTLSRGAAILDSYWYPAQGGQTEIPVELMAEHAPGVYLSISAILPLEKADSGQALRLFGVSHLEVTDPATRIPLKIHAPETLEPESRVSLEVETETGRPAQVVIALVDEGLLNLTGFETPDPWKSFYGKLALGVRGADMFDQVIGAFHDAVYRRFSIGGGEGEESFAARAAAPMMEAAMDKAGGQEERGLQFEPLSLVAGPLTTDSRGRVQAEFELPNYLGSVRIMAVALEGMAFGSTHIDRPVQRPLVTLPSPPRFLGPGDSFELPVSLIPLEKDISQVRVTLDSKGILTPGSQTRLVDLTQSQGGTTILLPLTAPLQVGRADLELVVEYRDSVGTSREDRYPLQLDVQPATPQISRSSEVRIPQGGTENLGILADGLPGTNSLSLSVSTVPNLNLEERLSWLLGYPYGCLEQTISAVFPQLFLEGLVDPQVLQETRDPRGRLPAEAAIDRNISRALETLTRFQLPNGGFSYWPGQSEASLWGTNYAGAFLLEAKAGGHELPKGMMEGWLEFQSIRSRSTREDMTNRVYRLYLLAKAGKPEIAAMNLIRETALGELTDPELWLLAGSYHLSGLEDLARSIRETAGTRVASTEVDYRTYGSPQRDRALILEQALILGDQETADKLFADLSADIASRTWYSTQTLGYSLAALGKYLGIQGDPRGGTQSNHPQTPGQNPSIRLNLPGGGTRELVMSGLRSTLDLGTEVFPLDNPDQPVTIGLSYRSGAAPRVFARLSWSGISLTSQDQEQTQGMNLGISWFTPQGSPLDVRQLDQGQEFYALIRLAMDRDRLEEAYLDFGIPGGWEIVPTRLTGEAPPVWAGNLEYGTTNLPVEYQDLRDDRSLWFFDSFSPGRSMLFLVKLQAVTPGRYSLPPVSAGGMYDHRYRALYPGGQVMVRPSEPAQ